MSDSETKSDSENETPNCANTSRSKECIESPSKGVKKNKKKRTIKIIKEVDVSDDDTDEDQDVHAVDEAAVKVDKTALDTPAPVKTAESTRSSWVYTLFKLLFLLSCVSTISSGIFVAHTIHTAPNSKLGKLFIKSGHFISELVTIMTDDKAPLLTGNDRGEIKGVPVYEKITTEGVKHKKSSNKGKTSVKTETVLEQPPLQDSVGFSLQSVYDSVMHVVALYTEEEVEVEVIDDELEEVEDELEEVEDEATADVAEKDKASHSGGSSGLRIGLADAIGVVLLVGSAVIRYRPELRAINDAQLKYFRKEKNVKFARTASYFVLFLSVILLGGWLVLRRGNSHVNISNHERNEVEDTDGSQSLRGKLSVSDIIAVVIVVLSIVLLVTKQLTQAKRFNSAKPKYKRV
mmetsp:Transcript_20351/g.37761  ORF Transcript_20351/g.37761 Transcript_20351/m.37761 type:complete len:405 (-) Transcript_20351:154-1368(-)